MPPNELSRFEQIMRDVSTAEATRLAANYDWPRRILTMREFNDLGDGARLGYLHWLQTEEGCRARSGRGGACMRNRRNQQMREGQRRPGEPNRTPNVPDSQRRGDMRTFPKRRLSLDLLTALPTYLRGPYWEWRQDCIAQAALQRQLAPIVRFLEWTERTLLTADQALALPVELKVRWYDALDDLIDMQRRRQLEPIVDRIHHRRESTEDFIVFSPICNAYDAAIYYLHHGLTIQDESHEVAADTSEMQQRLRDQNVSARALSRATAIDCPTWEQFQQLDAEEQAEHLAWREERMVQHSRHGEYAGLDEDLVARGTRQPDMYECSLMGARERLEWFNFFDDWRAARVAGRDTRAVPLPNDSPHPEGWKRPAGLTDFDYAGLERRVAATIAEAEEVGQRIDALSQAVHNPDLPASPGGPVTLEHSLHMLAAVLQQLGISPEQLQSMARQSTAPQPLAGTGPVHVPPQYPPPQYPPMTAEQQAVMQQQLRYGEVLTQLQRIHSFPRRRITREEAEAMEPLVFDAYMDWWVAEGRYQERRAEAQGMAEQPTSGERFLEQAEQARESMLELHGLSQLPGAVTIHDSVDLTNVDPAELRRVLGTVRRAWLQRQSGVDPGRPLPAAPNVPPTPTAPPVRRGNFRQLDLED